MTEKSHPFPTVYFDGGCSGLRLLEAGYRIFLVFRRGWRKT